MFILATVAVNLVSNKLTHSPAPWSRNHFWEVNSHLFAPQHLRRKWIFSLFYLWVFSCGSFIYSLLC